MPDLHELRAIACEGLAKFIIEGEEEDMIYLMQEMLLKRYIFLVDGEDTKPVNAIEGTVDLHAVGRHRRQRLSEIIIWSVAYLELYTGAINTINPGRNRRVEGLLYITSPSASSVMRLGSSKNWTLLRWLLEHLQQHPLRSPGLVRHGKDALDSARDYGSDERFMLNKLSYDWLAISAPMFWMRLLHYLDSFRFFGAMLVV
ncbi:hypothetical protein ABVK25_011930 [Lepraria finkii]|uniref:YVC1 N-terminal linker helical domain-containing protein n=1 Tax=Lepraria finkii TaxID=1340010 RepID=A0ABR4AMM6_9LECA